MRKFMVLVGVAVFAAHLKASEQKLVPRPAIQDLVRENNMLLLTPSSKSQALDLVPEKGFEEGRHYEFRVRYTNANVSVLIAQEREIQEPRKDAPPKSRMVTPMVNISSLGDAKKGKWHGVKATEFFVQDSVWKSRQRTVSLNYVAPEQTFDTVDNVARWQEKEALALAQDLEKSDIRLGLDIAAEYLHFYANGVLLMSVARAPGDLDCLALRIPKKTAISDIVEVCNLHKLFHPVDITERLNAAGVPGGSKIKTPAPGSEISVEGIPFLFSGAGRLDHLDLSMSWMEAAMRCGYTPTEVWTRWKEATIKTPLRYQFRVPFDRYDALYVLAASDGRKDCVPRFTAQFYLPRRGRPVSVASPEVPVFDAAGKVQGAFPVTLANGKTTHLYLVKLQLEPGAFVKFSKSDFFDMELTKDVQVYRAYPDPLTHSTHGAGLPSAVKVFAMTFGVDSLSTTFSPDAFANIWRDGQKPSYTVELRNLSDTTRKAHLTFKVKSYDGTDEYTATSSVSVKPGATQTAAFSFSPKRFGHYSVVLVKNEAGRTQTYDRSLAYLRNYERKPRSFNYKGMFFGCWSVRSVDTVRLAGEMGMDGFSGLHPANDEARALMKQYGMKDFIEAATARAHGALKGNKNEAEDLASLREKIPPLIRKASDIHEPVISPILCEPGGIGTGHAQFGEYFGEEPFDFTKLDEKKKARYELYKYNFMTVHKAIRELLPKTTILMPNGSWTFAIPYLQDPDTRNLFDGVKCDFQFYTRLPEQQMHQCSIHSMYYFQNAWKKYRPDKKPLLVFGEGPDVSPVYPGACTEEIAAAHRIRCSIIMAGYGANHQHSWATSIHQSGGENHCTGGFLDNEVSLNPELAYSAFATHIRHMRDSLFESYSNPGSFSAYCANFRNHKTGRLIRVIWSIRGTREFVFKTQPGKLEIYDAMDNLVKPSLRDGNSVVRVAQMPVYVYGTDEKTEVSLGTFDHNDARLDSHAARLGNAAELFTTQTADADVNYVEMMPEYIKRFVTKMDVTTQSVDAAYGGKALAVTLPPQEKDRGLMPYYTCLKPAKPIPIKGKASHLLVWAKANSDWGRIVYVLRDAKNQIWYGVGRKGDWNGDDMPGDSAFCFDGWRLLRYELPANAPWDMFRELGFTCWGSDSKDSVVELPLALEKIFIERRSSVMYGNNAHKIQKEQPVLLGDLFVEYAGEHDATDEVVRLSKIRAPVFPAGSLPNPIADMKKTGTLTPGKITGVKDPDTWFDGTRGVFSFEMPTNAVAADIWMSLYPDGRGALRQGKALKASPAQVSGFLAGTEFHAFLVYTDAEGNTSQPSEAFKFKMEDHFAHQ